MPCSSESKSPNIEKALKKILHDLNTYDFRFHENYGLIMFCNGKERRTYYFADVRVPVGKRILHENIFYLPEGEYRHIEQPELNLTKVPKLFKDLFAIPYDKIVIVTPAQTGYTLSCLLPPHMPALQL